VTTYILIETGDRLITEDGNTLIQEGSSSIDTVSAAGFVGGVPVITGLRLYLEADTLALSNGAAVSTWADASGAGNNATQVTAVEQPTYLTGAFPTGEPGVAFDGINDWLGIVLSPSIAADLYPVDAHSVFAVFIARSFGTSSATVYENDAVWSTSGGYTGLHLHATGPKAVAYAWDTDADTLDVAVLEDQAVLVHQRHEGGSLYASKNGGTEASAAHGNTDGTANTNLFIGANAYTAFADVVVGALLVYNRALTTEEVAAVNSYLAAKYVVSDVDGTLAVTEGADIAAIAGTAYASVTGTVAVTEGADVLVAAGNAQPPGTAGDLNVTEGADTLAASGGHGVAGTIAVAEGADSLVASGTHGSGGSLAVTESPDTLAAAGAVLVVGTADITEEPDTLEASSQTGVVLAERTSRRRPDRATSRRRPDRATARRRPNRTTTARRRSTTA
jgi:hypothetical protein